MPRNYRIVTALMAFTGCLSLVISGELMPLFMIPGIALIPGYYRFIKGHEPAPRWAIAVLAAIAAGLVAFDTLVISGDFFVAVAHMTISFQAIKSFDLRKPWDHLQVYFMSLLQLIMTSELAISMEVGGMFGVFLVIFVAAMVLSHFLRENTLGTVPLVKPVAVVSLVIFIATAIFFVAVPRVRGNIWHRKTSFSIRSVGFSEKVEFGSFGEVLEDSSIVMRVSITGPKLPLYWRGRTLDHFDGTSWTDTLQWRRRQRKPEGRFTFPHAEPGQPLTVQKIYLEPIDTDVVFGLGVITEVESAGWYLFRDVGASLYLPLKSDRRFWYTAFSVPEGDLAARRRYVDYYLQLPEGTEGIKALAGQITAQSGTHLEAAHAIENYLLTNYSYSLKTSPPPEGTLPIMDFLFNSKTGYCEHFATAMILMLRSVGIPSRIVTGFAGGETNAAGDYIIVRQRDAHSWVEADIDGKWMRFDPTPPAPASGFSSIGLMLDSLRLKWYRYVVGYDVDDQRAIFSSITAPVFSLPEIAGVRLSMRPVYLVVLVIILLPLSARSLLRGLSKRMPFETRIYIRLKRAVKKRGGAVRSSSSPGEVLAEARRVKMDLDSVSELISFYERIRFGGQELDDASRERFKELSKAILPAKE